MAASVAAQAVLVSYAIVDREVALKSWASCFKTF